MTTVKLTKYIVWSKNVFVTENYYVRNNDLDFTWNVEVGEGDEINLPIHGEIIIRIDRVEAIAYNNRAFRVYCTIVKGA